MFGMFSYGFHLQMIFDYFCGELRDRYYVDGGLFGGRRWYVLTT